GIKTLQGYNYCSKAWCTMCTLCHFMIKLYLPTCVCVTHWQVTCSVWTGLESNQAHATTVAARRLNQAEHKLQACTSEQAKPSTNHTELSLRGCLVCSNLLPG